MAAKAKKPVKQNTWQPGSILKMLVVALFGGGIGGYVNPELPLLGPLVQSLQSRFATDGSSAAADNRFNEIPSTANGNPPQALPPSSGPPPGVLVSTQRPDGKLLIATFNIQVFGTSKLAKREVMDVIVQTIRQFDIVAIQEVRSKDDDTLPKLVSAINENGSRYHYLIGPRLGRTTSTEQYAFVYDTNRVEHDPSAMGTVPDPKDLLHREPFVARFRPRTNTPDRAFSFWLVNIHTDPDEVPQEVAALADVFQMMRAARPDEDDVILLGDLNASESEMGRLGQIPGIHWVVRGTMTNTRRTKAYDNILFDGSATNEYTGRWGVLDLTTIFGLTLDKALEVSDHLPVWAEYGVWENANQQFTERNYELRR